MPIDPWQSSPLYRSLVVTALACSVLGIVLSIAGTLTGTRAISFISLGLLGIGMVTFLLSFVARLKALRRGK